MRGSDFLGRDTDSVAKSSVLSARYALHKFWNNFWNSFLFVCLLNAV